MEAAPSSTPRETGLDKAGVRFGQYLLTEQIGRGGMAVVYKGRIEGPNGFVKPVVVKRLLPDLTSKPEFVDLFTTEAKTTAQLSHPGIVQVYDFGILDGTPYLVMELLDGVDLWRLCQRAKLRNEKVPVEVAVIVMTQVCHALGYAHDFRGADGKRLQIVHGDVSPANVMVCRDGSAKLLDFGVVRVLGQFDFEMSRSLRGKFGYLAPEQVNRGPSDRRVDVFAAGIVLWEMLTGARLFFSSTDKETLLKVHAARVQPPSELNPAVSPELDALVLKALKRHPGDRFDSGAEMASALESLSRIGGGRRRVAEFVARMLREDTPKPEHDDAPDTLLVEPSASSNENVPTVQPLQPVIVPPRPSVIVQPAILNAPAKARPASITEVVRLPAKVTPVTKRRMPTALVGGVAAAVLAATVLVVTALEKSPSSTARGTRARRAPVLDVAPRPPGGGELPVPAVDVEPMAPSSAPEPIAPAAKPVTTTPSRVRLQRHPRGKTQSATPHANAPLDADVDTGYRDGELVDPFGDEGAR